MTTDAITIETTESNGRRTTTVFKNSVRVGYVQHTTLWATSVLDNYGKMGRFGRMMNYWWPGQDGYVCGSIPADLVDTVRELVVAQRAEIKAARGY